LGVFFNEGPKLIHLDLGKLEVSEVSKEHIGNMFTMQSSNGQPLADGIELDLQDAGGSPKPQPLRQKPEAHKDSLLGASKTEEGGAGTAGKGLATSTA
jgi:hypothetical protein